MKYAQQKSPEHAEYLRSLAALKIITRDLDWFLKYVNKHGPIPERYPELGPCWIWTSKLNRKGYGYFQIQRCVSGKKQVLKTWTTHRYSWFLHFGTIPEGLSVLHHCDNPPCCNPVHVFVGTQKDNSDDKLKKGRGARGEQCGSAIISNETARTIKTLLRDGLKPSQVSRELQLPYHVVSHIHLGSTFAWLQI